MKKGLLLVIVFLEFACAGAHENLSADENFRGYLQEDIEISSERQIPGVYSENELLSFAVKEFKKWTFRNVGELGKDHLSTDIARIGKPLLVRRYDNLLSMDVNDLYYFYVPVYYYDGSLAAAQVITPIFDKDKGAWSVSSSTGIGNIMMNTIYMIPVKDAKKYLEDYLSIKIKKEPIAVHHPFSMFNFRSNNWFWYFHFDEPILINGVDIYNIYMNPYIDNKTDNDTDSGFRYKPRKGSLKDITLEDIFSEQTSQCEQRC